jgi:hypothetical protein
VGYSKAGKCIEFRCLYHTVSFRLVEMRDTFQEFYGKVNRMIGPINKLKKAKGGPR